MPNETVNDLVQVVTPAPATDFIAVRQSGDTKDKKATLSQYVSGGGGILIQSESTQTGAVATGTTRIFYDSSIPQNTEGTEFLAKTITPTNALNILEITATLVLTSASNGIPLIAALFQDSTSSALSTTISTASDTEVVTIFHRMVAGTTSPTTFKIRAGFSVSSGTIILNGKFNGSAIFGGTCSSSLTIKEISV